MFDRLLPKALDNAYRGSWAAVWLFAPVLAMKTLIGLGVGGLNPFASTAHILETVDGVPLSTYPAPAAEQIIFMSSAWGVAMLCLCVLCWLILFRYRACLPLAIFALFAEQSARKLAAVADNPAGAFENLAAGAIINWAFTAVLALAFVLSLLAVRPARALGSNAAHRQIGCD